MLETDPITNAQATLLGACQAVLRGGDPNQLKGPTAALLRAKGQGKVAMAILALPSLPYIKPPK